MWQFHIICFLFSVYFRAKADTQCNAIFVRWQRVKLVFGARAEGPYSFYSCKGACTNNEDPMRSGSEMQCSGFNYQQGPNDYTNHCQLYQADQLQHVDGFFEADDRYTFYWKYCIKSEKKCSGDYAFTFLSDRYMDQREVFRINYTKSLEECLNACLNENQHACRSVSFNRTDGGCQLSEHNELSRPALIKINNNPNYRIDYYENNCMNIEDSFKFDYQCKDDGVLVKVESEYPYSGAMYGLYDFFKCRIEPKEAKKIEYFFPFPTASEKCSDSFRYKDKDIVLEIVISTDGVEPLYYITPDDLTYQARCPLNGNIEPDSKPGTTSKLESSNIDPRLTASAHALFTVLSETSKISENFSESTTIRDDVTTISFASSTTKDTFILPFHPTTSQSTVLNTESDVSALFTVSTNEARPLTNSIEHVFNETSEVGNETNYVIMNEQRNETLVSSTDSTDGDSLSNVTSVTTQDITHTESHLTTSTLPSTLEFSSTTTLSEASSSIENENDLSYSSNDTESIFHPNNNSTYIKGTTSSVNTDYISYLNNTESETSDFTGNTTIENLNSDGYNITDERITTAEITSETSILTNIDSNSSPNATDNTIQTTFQSEAQPESIVNSTYENIKGIAKMLADYELLYNLLDQLQNASLLYNSTLEGERLALNLNATDNSTVDAHSILSNDTLKEIDLITIQNNTAKSMITNAIEVETINENSTTIEIGNFPISFPDISSTTEENNLITKLAHENIPIENTVRSNVSLVTENNQLTHEKTKSSLQSSNLATETSSFFYSTISQTDTPSNELIFEEIKSFNSSDKTKTISEVKTATKHTKITTTPAIRNLSTPVAQTSNPQLSSQDAVIFDIFHNGQPVEVVVLGSRITLSFIPYFAIPPSYMSITGCQVEPISPLYEWELEPLSIIKDGCQADHVGLVCPPQKTDYGVRVTVESFRYQTTAHVQYTCLVRICPFAPCPINVCDNVEGCPSDDLLSRVFGSKAKRHVTLEEIRAALAANPDLQRQIQMTNRFGTQAQTNSETQQQLIKLGGDHIVKRRLVVVNSDDDLKYYVRTGEVP